MSRFGDDAPEMPRHQPFDDAAIDALLAGNTRGEGIADVAEFVADVRMSAGALPNPSPALAAALASGLSIDKGDLPATAASNVHGPARQAAGLPKWGRLRMKIQGFLAGLGVAGKVALGASLAAAATTGAGAAGVLPGPVQHVVAATVGSVTPFHFPDGDSGGSGSNAADGPAGESPKPEPGDTTSTTEAETSTTTHETTTVPSAHEGDGHDGTDAAPPTDGTNVGDGAGDGGIVTPTTEHHDGDSGSSGGDSTEPTTTPTTEHHGDSGGGGDSNNPQSLSISCERAAEPNRISCHWTASTSADHAKYVLLRISDASEHGQVLLQSADALAFVDTSVTGGVGYGYRVISLRGDGTVESHSNVATILCCGGSESTTTTTTEHHEPTTTTTEHVGDGGG